MDGICKGTGTGASGIEMSKYSHKEWFAIFLGSAPLGVVRGAKKAAAAKVMFPGAIARAYASLADANKALIRGPGYNGDEPGPLF